MNFVGPVEAGYGWNGWGTEYGYPTMNFVGPVEAQTIRAELRAVGVLYPTMNFVGPVEAVAGSTAHRGMDLLYPTMNFGLS